MKEFIKIMILVLFQIKVKSFYLVVRAINQLEFVRIRYRLRGHLFLMQLLMVNIMLQILNGLIIIGTRNKGILLKP